MDISILLGLLFRWMHILAAITAVGGSIFIRLVAFPSLDTLPADQRTTLHATMRARWAKIVAAAIAGLMLSGLYNVSVISLDYTLPRWYMPLFGVKLMAALGIFLIASLLVGRTPAADELRKHARFWLNLNIALAVLVVCLSGILRTADKSPKHRPEPATPASMSTDR